MKGIVLAGGTGSRLFPLTKITNKHLLPIFDKPMIYHPIQTLVGAGIKDILLVTGGRNSGDFLRLLANGKEFGLAHLNYTYQEGEGGIADALALAEHFADGHKICVILGDNIIEGSIAEAVPRGQEKHLAGACILLEEAPGRQAVSASPNSRTDASSGSKKSPRIPSRPTPSPVFISTTRPYLKRSAPWCPASAGNSKSPTSTTPISAKEA